MSAPATSLPNKRELPSRFCRGFATSSSYTTIISFWLLSVRNLSGSRQPGLDAAMAVRSRVGTLRLVVLLSSLAAASGFWPAGVGMIPIAPEHAGRSVAGSRRYSTRRLALTRRTRPLETKQAGVHGLRSMAVDKVRRATSGCMTACGRMCILRCPHTNATG